MPLMRRRPVLRAAAVSGGAYAIGKRHARVASMHEQQAQVYKARRRRPSAPPDHSAGGLSAEDTDRLGELGRPNEQHVPRMRS